MNWDTLLEEAKKVLAEAGDSFSDADRRNIVAAIEDYAILMATEASESDREHAKAQLANIQAAGAMTGVSVLNLAVARLIKHLSTLVIAVI